MESNDKDFRYMAANDLIAALGAQDLNMDDRLENKVRAACYCLLQAEDFESCRCLISG